MTDKTKKIFFIIIAFFVGAMIVLATIATQKNVFDQKNSDNFIDKTNQSWKSSLIVVPGEESLAQIKKGTLSSAYGDGVSEKATTSTDIIARKLIVEYAAFQRGAATTTLSDTSVQIIAADLVKEVKLPLATQYTLSSLNVSYDNSEIAVMSYTKAIQETISTFVAHRGVHELVLMSQVIENNNPDLLDKLNSIAEEYKNLNKNLLKIKTPSSVAPIHLRLIQSYENIRISIIGMQDIFSDPINGLAGITRYKNEVGELDAIADEYRNYKLP